MRATLHVISGPDQGRLFSLGDQPVTIGRNADNTIVLNDVSVSGLHSRIVPNDTGGFTCLDASSTNGTFVNSHESKAAELHDGDEIRIGESVLAFHQRRKSGIQAGSEKDIAAVSTETGQSEPSFSFQIPTTDNVETSDLVTVYRRAVLLERLDSALARLENSKAILGAILDASLAGTGALRGFVLLIDEKSGELLPSVARNLGEPGEIEFSKPVALSAAADRKTISTEHDGSPVICAPIVATGGHVVGVLYLDHPQHGSFEAAAVDTVNAIGRRAGSSVIAARSRVDFDMLFSSMIDAIMRSIQAKDVYTRGHSERVRHYSKLLGKELGLSQDELYRVSLGAALHDIGKIGMPDSVLKFNKTPRLTEEQLKHVKHHPVRGAQILKNIPFLQDIVPAAELHHEDWDGTGYPHGLAGEQIPLIARIVAVADTFDAITTDRPYQKGRTYEDGFGILRKIGGSRLEPELVEAFVAGFTKYRKRPSRSEVRGTIKIPSGAGEVSELPTKAVAAVKPSDGAAPPPSIDEDGDLDQGLQNVILIG